MGITNPLRRGTNRTLERPGTILAVALACAAQQTLVNMIPPIPMDPGGIIRNNLVNGFFETWKVNIING